MTLSFNDYQVGYDDVLVQVPSRSLSPGLYALIAPNGLGKSSFLRTLAGLMAPLGGEVRWNQKPFNPDSDCFYLSEYLTLPKYIMGWEWIQYVSHRKFLESTAIQDGLKDLSLSSKEKRFLGEMSLGERRKLMWLGARFSERPVVLLDEPFNGLDLTSIDRVRKYLEEWSRNRVVILVSHHLNEILPLCREVWVVQNRQLSIWEGSLDSRNFSSEILQFYGGENR